MRGLQCVIQIIKIIDLDVLPGSINAVLINNADLAPRPELPDVTHIYIEGIKVDVVISIVAGRIQLAINT